MNCHDNVFRTHPQPGLVLPRQPGQPWNLGIVDAERMLVRGAAPANKGADLADSLPWLRAQGIRTLAILNETEQGIDREAELALAAEINLQTVCFDWERMLREKDSGEEPQWRRFRALAEAGALYVHCVWGVDRTGATLARVRRELYGWTAQEAFSEVRSYGFAFETPVQDLQPYQEAVLSYFDFELEDYAPLQPGHPDHTACLVREETAIGD